MKSASMLLCSVVLLIVWSIVFLSYLDLTGFICMDTTPNPEVTTHTPYEPGTCGTNTDFPRQIYNPPVKPRFSTKTLSDFLSHSFHEWEGWLGREDMFAMGLVTTIQHRMGIVGSIGEIGVHHGKFAIPIAMFADKSEKFWAADLFDMQEENIDGSGKGDKDVFMTHLKEYGVGSDDSYVQSINSMNLETKQLKEQSFHGFRLISIDGGHTHNITLNDLVFACRMLLPGGVLILDDFVNTGWLGVASGLFSFLNQEKKVGVFFWGTNKIFLTSSDSIDMYVKELELLGLCMGERTFVLRYRKIFNDRVCTLDCCQERMDDTMFLRLLGGNLTNLS
eukprot:CAMPEP_0118693708 /NCGR_PEP_ID=MMETSP0800-20121206/12070_1 /TAXON_ID=210618 ORGANISM="Striatella unipunctata, Strain CCMP2910" /NCGR_SAMPLE_ID=MMETSP0800 /ASSEMBLY_ACC=CAM_ASM_000638 /LENGTH=334 /DNA_ID=CAMNT_0006591997 /DNA_START=65 /DNA_END=1069 /DNA_ORIENTATION=-